MSSQSVTRMQLIVTFLLIAVVGITLGLRTEYQQREIAATERAILQSDYEGCLGGVIILSRFNDQQDALAKIERGLSTNPGTTQTGRDVAAQRVKAYEAAKVFPLPTCVKR